MNFKLILTCLIILTTQCFANTVCYELFNSIQVNYLKNNILKVTIEDVIRNSITTLEEISDPQQHGEIHAIEQITHELKQIQDLMEKGELTNTEANSFSEEPIKQIKELLRTIRRDRIELSSTIYKNIASVKLSMTKSAEKDFNKLSFEAQSFFNNKIKIIIQDNPQIGGIRKTYPRHYLFYRFQFKNQQYRVGYKIIDNNVEFMAIGTRESFYNIVAQRVGQGR